MVTYAPVYGIVNSVNPFPTSPADHGCSLLISIMTQNLGEVNFVVSQQTFVVNQHTFVTGDSIIAIYDTTAPVPLIYPPQFKAVILAQNEEGYSADFDFYDENLLNQSNTLRLNIPEDGKTNVLLSNGQYFFNSPGGHYLFVLYLFSTRSIPAITTPRTVIVFCSPDE